MPQSDFTQLPDDARLWVFHAPRRLTAEEKTVLEEELDRFLAGWQAHGAAVTSGFNILHDQFILIGVNEAVTDLSGCSIDAMRNHLGGVEQRLGLSLNDSPPVCWKEGETIRCGDRDEFRSALSAGTVNGETMVFNEMITTVGELRAGRFELPARESWHQRAFRI